MEQENLKHDYYFGQCPPSSVFSNTKFQTLDPFPSMRKEQGKVPTQVEPSKRSYFHCWTNGPVVQ